MSSEPVIDVHHLSKVYALGLSGRTRSLPTILRGRVRHPIRGGGAKRESFRALDDVTFDVAAGEAVGVIGKNGAGKSTLLKILSRITPPSGGYIEMAGSVGSLLEVGTGFHPELTGIENVYLNGTILGMTKREIDHRLEEIVDFAEVHRFLDTPVKRYSSGMRVRLAFAVAAHLDPEVLIIDEVLSVGDHSFQAKCLEKMRSVAADEGRTVLYVSHNLVTVEHLCPRAMVLSGGRLVFDGDSKGAVARYLALFPQAERGVMPGVFDLSAGDRSGSEYEEVFKRLELRPSGGAPSDSVRVGERLRIEVMVEGFNALVNPLVQVTVGQSSSAPLFRMNSRMVPLEAAHERRDHETIVMDIPSLPLTPGDYTLDLVAWDGNHRKLDELHPAARFSVVPADVFGTGYQPLSTDGHFVIPWEWELRPSELTSAAKEPGAATQAV